LQDIQQVGLFNEFSVCACIYHFVFVVSIANKVYLFGGFDGISQHFHLAVYDTIENTWETPEVSGFLPPSRTNHAAASLGSRMYLFGGMYKECTSGCGGDKLVFLNDMYMLESAVTPMRWTKIIQQGDVPAARCGHRLLAIGSRILLFGGGCGEQWDVKYNDIHVFDPATNVWTKPKVHGIAPVCTFTIAFSSGVFLFLFGGQSIYDNNLTNDLYVLDTVHMAWTKLQAHNAYPSARDMASGNVVANTMHMFGGYCGAAIDSFFMLQMDPALDPNPISLPPYA
jgi:Rab9 effector protein with kelch motifs